MYETVVQSLKAHEGFRSMVYNDHLGNPTIGYGFLVSALDPSDELEAAVIRDRHVTVECAEQILRDKVIKIANAVRSHHEWFDQMPERVQDVILEMIYQMGLHNFNTFKCTINAMKNRRFIEAKKFMLNSKWASQTPGRARELACIVGAHGNQA